MPNFFRKRLASGSSSIAPAVETPSAPITNNSMNESFLEKKIYRSIYALGDDRFFAFPRNTAIHRSEGPESMVLEPIDATLPLAPLQPSRRRNRELPKAHISTPESSHKLQSPLVDHGENVANASSSSPFMALDSPAGTFGRKAIPQGKSISKVKNTLSQLSQGRPRSRDTSRARNSDMDAESETPRSEFYFQHSSSSSLQNPDNYPKTPSSGNTFGTPTSTPSTGRFRATDVFFRPLETPPPLPPLDHPAFHLSSKTLSNLADRQTNEQASLKNSHEEEKHPRPRHSQSLPSMRLTRRSSNMGSTRPRRKGSKSSFISRLNESHQSKDIDPPKKGHTRSDSKSSITSSRRSSAEISAKKASLLGLNNRYDETWEAKVSRELLRLSLAPGVVEVRGHSSARGNNRSQGESGEARGLGSAFSSRDTFTPDQAQPLDRSPAVYPEKQAPSLRKTLLIDSGITVSMSEGHVAKYAAKNVKASASAGKLAPKSDSPPRRGGKPIHKSTPDLTRAPSPPPRRTAISPAAKSHQASSSLLVPPVLSFTSPTPEASPISPTKRTHHKSSPTLPHSALRTPSQPAPIQKSFSSASGKRKADEAEVDGGTPPKKHKEHRATFAPEPRTHRGSANSGSSHAPSSFHRSKRVRVSLSSDPQQPISRTAVPSMSGDSPNAKSTGSWSSRGSTNPATHSQSHHASLPPSTRDIHTNSNLHHAPRRSASRRSISNASIPISAFMSPHAPSVSRSSTFHMRDPRKPARIQDTPWTLSFPDEVQAGQSRWSFNGWVERGGSPLHGWLFFLGFIVFPLWWVAAFIPIPRTRRLEAGEAEKGVILDDPQVEHDFKSWRKRCRIMSVVSLVTYLPFIVLLAIFV